MASQNLYPHSVRCYLFWLRPLTRSCKLFSGTLTCKKPKLSTNPRQGNRSGLDGIKEAWEEIHLSNLHAVRAFQCHPHISRMRGRRSCKEKAKERQSKSQTRVFWLKYRSSLIDCKANSLSSYCTIIQDPVKPSDSKLSDQLLAAYLVTFSCLFIRMLRHPRVPHSSTKSCAPMRKPNLDPPVERVRIRRPIFP